MEESRPPMSLEFVLDSSVTMAWFFEDETASSTDTLLDELNREGRAVVAMHWALEVTNTLLMGERRKRCSAADSAHFLDILDSLPIETDEDTADKAVTTTMALARNNGLTLYDAAYLELAMRRKLPLASLDKDLRAAARKNGVECLPENI
jgi:predicted nucleic acid-binding protein